MKTRWQDWKLRIAGVGCASLLAASSAFAQATLTTTVAPSPALVGSAVLVNVQLNNVLDLFGYQFSLSFNPAVLQATGVSSGAFLPSGGSTFFSGGTIDNTLGTVSFVFDTLLGPVPGVNGSGVLANVGFNAVSAGSSTLNFADVLVLNSASDVLNVEVINGSVQVVPEPSAAVLLGLGLAALAWRRRATA